MRGRLGGWVVFWLGWVGLGFEWDGMGRLGFGHVGLDSVWVDEVPVCGLVIPSLLR